MSMTVCMNIFDDNEARRIAEDLTAKYGGDALAHAKARAERAFEIGDDLAQAIWRKVITVASELMH
jgi:hypothetical protein